MFNDWYNAHVLEWIVGGVMFGGSLLIIGVTTLMGAIRDKRRERRKLDADYQALQDKDKRP